MRTSLIVSLTLAATVPLAAQWLHYPTPGVPRSPDGKPNLSAPTPRAADGKPDLSGLWSPGQTRLTGRGKSFANANGRDLNSAFFDVAWGLKDGLPYQPWAAELALQRNGTAPQDTPETKCLPNSLVQKAAGPGAIHMQKIIQTPGLLIILYERNVEYRQLFTDGRPLPADPNPSWNGYSTGKWDGDTLVVQTNGFRDDTWIDFFGTPLTSSALITERFRRPTYGQLQLEITVDDPKAYTAPWTLTTDRSLVLDTELLEYVCLENERDNGRIHNPTAGK